MQLKEQNGKFVYSDGVEIEEQMMAIAQNYPEDASAEFISQDSHYTINNTFSPVRHNLLNWYPFSPNAEILEVGAGMGSMTGLLCDVAKSVTALEFNEARANVIRSRFPDRTNLSIISADITTWHTAQRYDYIVVVGVLEYAAIFSGGRGNEPHLAFLKALRRLLKPNGIVLLAIENRFGLKYWLGAAEDHLQEPFVGISGYPDQGVRTFSKAELQSVFTQAGFSQQRYYYVLPDYKFPTAIFTDEQLPCDHDLLNIGFTYSRGSQLIANERDIYKDILANGMFDNFANSYLVEAGVETLPEKQIIRVNARGECKPQYRVVTKIDNQGLVCKAPIGKAAKAHVQKTFQNMIDLQERGVSHIEVKLENGDLVSSFEGAPLASTVFCDALNKADWNRVVFVINTLQAALEMSSEMTQEISPLARELDGVSDIEVGPILKNGYMDMTLYNSFWKNDSLVFFDQEWNFPGLPLRFILYYGLKTSFFRNEGTSQYLWSEILRYIKVNPEEATIWNQLEEKVWLQTLNRWGDVYGEDGYCNRYNDNLTLKHSIFILEEKYEVEKKELRREYEDIIAKKEIEIEERNAHIKLLDKNIEVLDAEKRRIDANIGSLARHANSIQENAKKQSLALEQQLNERTCEFNNAIWEKDQRIHELDMVYRSLSWVIPQAFFRFLRLILGWPFRWRNRYMANKNKQIEDNNLAAPLASEDNPDKLQFDHNSPKLLVPQSANPLVSIVIPVFNEFAHTYNCISSIIGICSDSTYEIILGDDCSTDETADVSRWIDGLIVVRHTENLRFLRNCNEAAQHAKGKYLVFLNNDTIVKPNWLDSLVELMESDKTIGLCGSKMLYPDGRLQEAGGIIWNDASAWNYGHGQDPTLPEFNYLKDVDYISGCSIMVRSTIWNELGGFDESFAPAYCEDSDLAFSVRKLGYRVVYQPLSKVIHLEGISNGTDLAAGQKQYQVRNKSLLKKKWKDALAKQYPPGTHILRARDRSQNKKLMLLVDHYIPTYDQDAGSKTTYDYIRLFMENGYQVILLPDNFHQSEYTQHYQQLGVVVLYGYWYACHWQNWFAENGSDFDVVFLNRPHISVKYIDFVRKNSSARILYYGHDLHFLREKRQFELEQNPKLLVSSYKWQDLELDLMRKSHCALYPSIEEEKLINEIDPTIRVRTLTAYIYKDMPHTPYALNGRDGLLFVGGFGHTPNVDAMQWFVREIFPKILAQNPKIRLHIVGSNPPPAVVNLASPQITVHGFVSSEKLEQMYKEARLCVVPLRYGAGIKGKVVEAMANGCPLVATSVGGEGLIGAESFLPIENDETAFAEKILQLYNNERMLQAIVDGGYQYINTHFSSEAALDSFKSALE